MSRARRWLASFLTGDPAEQNDAEANRRPTRVVRPVGARVPSGGTGLEQPDGQVALPDFVDPPGTEIVAGVDADGIEYVFEDDPYADPLVDPRYDADDRNWVRYRPNWGGYLRFVVIGLLVVFVIFWVRSRVYNWVDDEIVPEGPVGEEVTFVIPAGASTNDVASQLDDDGVIGNATVFRYWLRCDGDITISGFLGCDTEVSFQAGDYVLNENMPFQAVVDVFDAGPTAEVFFSVTIPEGLRVAEFVEKALEENDRFTREDLVEALFEPEWLSDYVPADTSPFNWYEGVLFPATYDIAEGDIGDEARFVDRLTDEFDRRFTSLIDEIGRDPVIEELGLTDYQIITIASLIEEEAKVAGDRPKMARGIYNRLLAGDILGIDASTYYAVNKSFTEPLTAEDLANPSPYNTRLSPWVPPTPIAAPGEASLQAALQPAPGDEEAFYYWARTDNPELGAHSFATLSEGNAEIVAECVLAGYCG